MQAGRSNCLVIMQNAQYLWMQTYLFQVVKVALCVERPRAVISEGATPESKCQTWDRNMRFIVDRARESYKVLNLHDNKSTVNTWYTKVSYTERALWSSG